MKRFNLPIFLCVFSAFTATQINQISYAQDSPMAVEGYYYFASPKQTVKLLSQLQGRFVCVKKGWRGTRFLKKNKIRVRALSYRKLEKGIRFLKMGACAALIIRKSASRSSELAVTFPTLVSRLKPPTNDKITLAKKSILESCKLNVYQNNYFDCDCVANDYVKKARAGTLPNTEAFGMEMMRGNVKCANPTAIRASMINHCVAMAEYADAPQAYKDNPNSYCECQFKLFISVFRKKPKLDTSYIENLEVDAMFSARKACR